ncbi:aminoglycoside phosphotransferase [Agrococcus sp. SL85]|uniref:maltokinase N-terminal cap-like domain-containing protein n=1 Tax=Agrococcus sp. SL85 TaxID=2995141 RepID=UPI00226CAC89|nr:aminoglycoside phosphotransferase [Agrococcus sp. SL85]WAC66491.1 aminoglycoside phosphotransferase [Agrococcus sp. SL85]
MGELTTDPHHLDDDRVVEAVAAWMPGTRWYPLKGTRPAVVLERTWPLGDDAAILLLRADDVLLQVPVALRDEPGEAPIARLGDRWLVDGCADPATVRALLAAATGTTAVPGLEGDAVETPAEGGIRVLAGEQSNTSIIGGDGRWIAKAFRVVSPGDNPEVVVTGALTRGGTRGVPRLLASLRGSWAAGETTVTGHLLAVSSFVAGGEDAWALFRAHALESVRGGASPAPDARGLGAAVATVHRELATALGTAEADDEDALRFVAGLEQRMAWARDEAAEALEPFAGGLALEAERLRGATRLGTLQQIHGDLHLGQVLRDLEGRWILLDFEGEPLRPLHERMVRETPLRDVVGMLRSFDYAAGSALQEARDGDADAARDWVAARQAEFLAGYEAEAGPVDRDDPVLRALLLDKALYEVVYEVRNRPEWLPVPLEAVRAIVG